VVVKRNVSQVAGRDREGGFKGAEQGGGRGNEGCEEINEREVEWK